MMKKTIGLFLIAVLTLSFAVPAFAVSYCVSVPRQVTVDGRITEEEWGSPLYKGVTLRQAENGQVDDVLTCQWFDWSNNAEASFDLYVTHTDTKIYIGCVIHNVDAEVSPDAADWQQMNFTFTLSDYHKDTDVRRVDYRGKKYEAYTGYRLAVSAAGDLQIQTLTQGMESQNLYEGSDCQALYDTRERSMTYEVAVPFRYTTIDPAKTQDIVLSAVIALNHYGNGISGKTDGANRWLIGTGAAHCGGPENWAHKDQCIRIKLASPEQIQAGMSSVAQGNANPKDMDVAISSEPEYRLITADAPISTPLIIMLISVIVIMACACVVTVTLVRDRNKKAEEAADLAATADPKEEDV